VIRQLKNWPRDLGMNPITLQTSPKHHPPKTTTQESYVKGMISMD